MRAQTVHSCHATAHRPAPAHERPRLPPHGKSHTDAKHFHHGLLVDEVVHESYRRQPEHWWFRSRARIFGAVLQRAVKLPQPARVLDVGPGSGIHLPLLRSLGAVTTLDRDPGSARACQAAEAAATLGDAQRLPFASNQFHLACALDVLEHLEDDRASLLELRRVLAPGSQLLITVPAWKILWGRQDLLSHHKRRYRRQPLSELLLDAGFEIERLTYFNTLLFPAILLVRLLSRPFLRRNQRLGKSDFDAPTPMGLDRWLYRLFALEARWLPERNLPIGVSLLALVKKPLDSSLTRHHDAEAAVSFDRDKRDSHA